MAIFNPTNTPIISKIQVGETLYYLTDAEARALLNQLGTAAKKDVAEGVSASEQGLVTGAQVQAAIADIAGAMHFRGVVTKTEGQTDAEALATVTDPVAGDVVIVGVKEYVYSGTAWQELGDESIYALKTVTIGTQTLANNISLDTLKIDLGLGDLAYKDSATGTVPAQTISGVKATGTSTGSIAVVLDQTGTAATLTKADYTPEGSVSGTTTAAGTVAIARDDENGTAVSGSVSAPTVTVTPSTASIQTIKTVGTQASFSSGTFSAGTLPTYSQGSKASWTASVRDETLSFNFTANGDDTFTQGTLPSHDADKFTANELPTKNDAMTVATGIESASASAPTFTGDKFGATFNGTSAAITATFTGTKATDALVTGVSYDKATVNAEGTKFTGAAITLDVGDITTVAKDVTVS